MPSSLLSRLSRMRSRSPSIPEPPRATPMTGASSVPCFTRPCSAGKIFLCARSPVMPNTTSASAISLATLRPLPFWGARALDVAAELTPHRGKKPVGEIVVIARAETREQRRREHGHGHARVDGGVDRPTALPGIRDFADEGIEAWVARERGAREIEQPRTHDAAMAPELRDRGEVEVVLQMRALHGVRRRFGIRVRRALARVCLAEQVEPFGISGHQAVLDAVVNHLHVMAGAARAAMQIAVRRGAGG